MTERDAYESCLTELNKVQAPSLLLKDFIYFFNKAVQQYINKRYNLFETNQQTTDDLRVLSNSIRLSEDNGKLAKHLQQEEGTKETNVFEDSYDCILPNDYLHILNVICEFEDRSPLSRCPNSCRMIRHGANKLDTNQWSSVITNYYMRPSVKQPYYYIININGSGEPAQSTDNRVEHKTSGVRYGNSTQPIMQIKYGNDAQRYTLKAVYVDYLRAPRYLSLTQLQLDTIEDTSNVIEFPDYVVYEIINEVVKLAMENGSDARMQTHIPVTSTIPQQAAQTS